MPKDSGFAVPVVVIFSVIFLIAPLFLWVTVFRSNNTQSVKGMSAMSGPYITINSGEEIWEVRQYQCKTKENCLESEESGDKVSIVNGTDRDGYKLAITLPAQTDGYAYLKIYMKSAREKDSTYKVTGNPEIREISSHAIDGSGYVLLIPLDNVINMGNAVELGVFSSE